MTQITNTYDTFSARGIREQLSDVIYRISPTTCPIMSNIGKGSVDGTYFEWQNDALAAGVGTNAQIQGNDYTSFPAVTPTTRLGNYTQISAKQVIVSGTLDRVSKAGRKNEASYQMALRAAELKTDIETRISQNGVASAGNSSTAATTAGLESFVRTNVSRGASGVSAVLSGTTQGYPTTAVVDGTTRAFTETILKSVHQSMYTSGAEAKMLVVGAAQKQTVSGFAGIAAQRRETGDKAATIIGAADAYVGDFGTLQIVPSRYVRNRTALFLDPSMVELVYLRPFFSKDLADTGDSTKKLLLVEFGLKVNHEGALGVAADLT